MINSVLKRFLKGAVAGAVVAMAKVSFVQPQIWSDFHSILMNLGIAGAYGALVGLLLALEKWANWTDTPTVAN